MQPAKRRTFVIPTRTQHTHGFQLGRKENTQRQQRRRGRPLHCGGGGTVMKQTEQEGKPKGAVQQGAGALHGIFAG